MTPKIWDAGKEDRMPTKPEPDVEGHAYKETDEAEPRKDPEADMLREPDVEGHAYKAQSGAESDEEPDVEGHMLKAPTKPAPTKP
jgi:hypothetical protein